MLWVVPGRFFLCRIPYFLSFISEEKTEDRIKIGGDSRNGKTRSNEKRRDMGPQGEAI